MGQLCPGSPGLCLGSLYKFYREQLGLWIVRAELGQPGGGAGLAGCALPILAGKQAGFIERFGFSKKEWRNIRELV